MKKGKTAVCLLLCAVLLLAAAPRASAAEMRFAPDFEHESLGEAMERYISENNISPRNITIGWYDIESGEEWYYGADVFMEGASTYKLPLAMVYADLVEEGVYTREDKFGSWTLENAIREMLVNSSNNAADALRYAYSQNHRTYREALVKNSGLDPESLPSGFYTANQFSPRFLIGTLRTLWDNSEKYGWLIDYMLQALPDSYFGRYRGEYAVAHKIGNALGYISDTGIIYTERPFLLTVMTCEVRDAERVTGEIARIAMDYAEYLAEQDEIAAAAATPEPTPELTAAPTPGPSPEPEESPEPTADAKKPGRGFGSRGLIVFCVCAAAAAAAAVALKRKKRKE